MYYVKNKRDGKEIHDPALNLAIEYHLLNHVILDEPMLLFYINDHSVIVGKNQNTYEEVNHDYIDRHHVNVVRRFSGGGAVYHDLGVLNFCFLTEDDGESFRNFKKFTDPVLQTLHKMGAKGAALQGRNDLMIEGKKFSGNAMYTKNGRLTAHGSILFDASIEAIVAALKPNEHKIKSRSVKSIRSRVTNIKPYLTDAFQLMNTKEFRKQLLLDMFGVSDISDVKEYVLTDDDWIQIEAFAKKYTYNHDWNYGESPEFESTRGDRLSCGTVEVRLTVKSGKISAIKIYGDFFGKGDISDVEEVLIGCQYDNPSLTAALNTLDLNKYFGDVASEDLIALIY